MIWMNQILFSDKFGFFSSLGHHIDWIAIRFGAVILVKNSRCGLETPLELHDSSCPFNSLSLNP